MAEELMKIIETFERKIVFWYFTICVSDFNSASYFVKNYVEIVFHFFIVSFYCFVKFLQMQSFSCLCNAVRWWLHDPG